jgi:hypothetical protein
MKFFYKSHEHPNTSTKAINTVGVVTSCEGCTYFYVRIHYNTMLYIYIYIPCISYVLCMYTRKIASVRTTK